MMIFKDRKSAGQLLVKRLTEYKNKQDTIVLGIPRGGVVVAYEVARVLNLPLDVVITRKIGAPSQKELALGAVDPDGKTIWDESLLSEMGLKTDDLKDEIIRQLLEIERREVAYRGGREPLKVNGEKVILVDDGIATGSTTLSAINFLKRLGAKKVILATPVVAGSVLKKLKKEADQVIVLHQPEHLGAVGQFYQNFEVVGDDQVIAILDSL